VNREPSDADRICAEPDRNTGGRAEEPDPIRGTDAADVLPTLLIVSFVRRDIIRCRADVINAPTRRRGM
jgi:hypothetical protein